MGFDIQNESKKNNSRDGIKDRKKLEVTKSRNESNDLNTFLLIKSGLFY